MKLEKDKITRLLGRFNEVLEFDFDAGYLTAQKKPDHWVGWINKVQELHRLTGEILKEEHGHIYET